MIMEKIDRTMIAAMAMQGILSNENSQNVAMYFNEKYKVYTINIAKYAVVCADALIAELRKEEK